MPTSLAAHPSAATTRPGVHRATPPAGTAQPISPTRPTPQTAPTTGRARRALLLENVHQQAVSVLEDAGWHVEHRTDSLTENELTTAIAGVDVLGVRSRTKVTERVLRAGRRLSVIGAFCIGTDQIDLAAAASHDIAVVNAPHSNKRSVAELAVAEVIALNRQLTERNREMHAGRWRKTASGSREIRGQRLGIIGYGNIGSQLSVLAEALGMRVAFYDTADRLPLGTARRCTSLPELLATSEVVSVHVDGRPENDRLLTARELALMPTGSKLLNLSRGRVVDLDDLASALRNGHLAGAALDVYPDEPGSNTSRYPSRLAGLPNVILTPHVAGSTEEAQRDIAASVASKLLAQAAATTRAAAA